MPRLHGVLRRGRVLHRRLHPVSGRLGFRKRVDAGENPADIVAEETAELEAIRERDKAANRKAKAAAARAEKERDERKARAAEPNLTERIGDDVRRLISEGKTVREIAAELKVAIASVTRTREALGIKGPPPGSSSTSPRSPASTPRATRTR
ncbi:helix-turn-helix domain-containing protein [Microbacterium paraoxydans]|uniref:Helix-turn-helix domain of resolvase n=1 Tax=Microbacterium paraoxydans TaxID=199592 RepID=A0A1H1XJ71_9MICO|nr:hypothetical protein [Microbacterium paraoxydans]SDT09335.1 hypothetical protein SAMN04489809_3496 [Microbacterium paraoxydans]